MVQAITLLEFLDKHWGSIENLLGGIDALIGFFIFLWFVSRTS